jgi:hypothetical protein
MLGIIYEYDLHLDTLRAIFIMVGIPWVNHVLKRDARGQFGIGFSLDS